MRVLLIVHGYPPAGLGGTEIYVEALAAALLAAGDEVFVLTREADPTRSDFETREETLAGVRILRINNCFRNVRAFRDTYLCAPIRRLAEHWLDRIAPDVVHVHHLTGLSGDLVDACAARGLPTVLTLHDFWLLCHRGQLLDLDLNRCAGPLENGCSRCLGAAAVPLPALGIEAARSARALLPRPLARGLDRVGTAIGRQGDGGAALTRERAATLGSACRAATRCLALSRTVEDAFHGVGIAPERLVRHELGLDLVPFRGLPRRTRERPLRLGFFGSLMVSKAPHLLLEAATPWLPDRIEVRVHGAHTAYHGDASYRGLLEPLLSRPGVEYRGALPHADVPAALAELDAVVVPSIWLENSPLVIREAFAAGLPVVTANLGGMAELVEDGRSGLLFRAGDAGDLQRCLGRLVDEAGLLDQLRSGIGPVRDIADDAETTRRHYREVITEVGPARSAPIQKPRSAPIRKAQSVPSGKPLATTAQAPAELRLAAVVLNFETPEDTALAVRSLAASRRAVERIFVVDNGSTDRSLERLRRDLGDLPQVELIAAGSNLGFSAGCNLGLEAALDSGAELLFLLNSDAIVPPDALGALERALAASPAAGIAGPLLLSRSAPDGIASAGMRWSARTGRMRHLLHGQTLSESAAVLDRAHTVDGVSGCALLVRRRVLEQVGLLAEEYFFSFEDLELCLRAGRAGFSTLCERKARVYHEGGRSIGAESPARLYYATRNHLLLGSKTPPAGLAGRLRPATILALNLAHAALAAGPVGVGAALRGWRDHRRGRYGPAPE